MSIDQQLVINLNLLSSKYLYHFTLHNHFILLQDHNITMTASSSQFYRAGDERPKSEKFLQFMKEKKASQCFSRRGSLKSSRTTTQSLTIGTKVTFACDESSMDPTIYNLAVVKLADTISHEDRKAFVVKLAGELESRQDETSTIQNNSESAISEETRNGVQQANSFLPENEYHVARSYQYSKPFPRLSISQRLVRAARYTEFVERNSFPECRDREESRYDNCEYDMDDLNSESAGDSPVDIDTQINRPTQPLKISERLKKASEYAEFATDTIASYKAKQQTVYLSTSCGEQEVEMTSTSQISSSSNKGVRVQRQEIMANEIDEVWAITADSCNTYNEEQASPENDGFVLPRNNLKKKKTLSTKDSSSLDEMPLSMKMSDPHFSDSDSILFKKSSAEASRSVSTTEPSVKVSLALIEKIRIEDGNSVPDIEVKIKDSISAAKSDPISLDNSCASETNTKTEMLVAEKVHIDRGEDPIPHNRANPTPDRDPKWKLKPALKMLSVVLLGKDIDDDDVKPAPCSSVHVDSDLIDECSMITTDI